MRRGGGEGRGGEGRGKRHAGAAAWQLREQSGCSTWQEGWLQDLQWRAAAWLRVRQAAWGALPAVLVPPLLPPPLTFLAQVLDKVSEREPLGAVHVHVVPVLDELVVHDVCRHAAAGGAGGQGRCQGLLRAVVVVVPGWPAASSVACLQADWQQWCLVRSCKQRSSHHANGWGVAVQWARGEVASVKQCTAVP